MKTSTTKLDASQARLAADQARLVSAWRPVTDRVELVWSAYGLYVDGLAPSTRLRDAVNESRGAYAPVQQALAKLSLDPRLAAARTNLVRAVTARQAAFQAVRMSEAARASGDPAGAARGLLVFADRWNAAALQSRLATTAVLDADDLAKVTRIREDDLR